MDGRWAAVPLGVVGLLALAGCLNYEEEMTLKADGSGEVTMHWWMPSSFGGMPGMGAGGADAAKGVEEQVLEELEGKEGVTVKSVTTEEKEGELHIYAAAAFEDVANLPTEGSQITFKRKGGQIHFARGYGGYDVSTDAAEREAGETPKDEEAAARHYEAGMQLKQAKQYQQAAAELQQAVEKDRDHLDAHWALAWTYTSLGDDASALQEFQEVSRLAPAGSEQSREAANAIGRLTAKQMRPSAGWGAGAGQMRPGWDQGMDQMTAGFMESMADSTFKFTVHFPGEVLAVEGPNASKSRNTATWQFTMAEMIGTPPPMKATAKGGFDIPLLPVALAAGAVVVILGLVVILRRRS